RPDGRAAGAEELAKGCTAAEEPSTPRARIGVPPGARRGARGAGSRALPVRRRGGGSVHDLLAQREPHQLGRLVEVELLHDLLAVGLDRVQAERERGRDLRVGAPLGDELEDLAFAPREPREVVVVPWGLVA